ncbi:hypothetical protein OE09_1037 [Flavobacteriaceae bacterium MAR_2010_72]|nr:hypothetical protein OE09_1037 [Flavobacteriaceae bacterium MAR_2010_72]TVZ60161.1 hypothetical protein NA63_2711 [Flavobacteriaceae bacterium MAR_2010_105]
MIKFFRKIRYDLMGNNKTSKYLKYAIGEIVLVVVGILIALSINNWNLARKHINAEKEFLQGIKTDLKKDKAYIDLVIHIQKPKIDVFNLLNSKLPEFNHENQIAMDSLFKIYFTSQRTFYPISGSFQSAVSGNEINSYKDKVISSSLINLYNTTYERLIDNGKISDDRWDYLSRKYSHERRIGINKNMSSSELNELLDDMYHHFVHMRWYQNQLIVAKLEIDDLLKKIN